MRRRTIFLLALAFALGACTIERGEDRVWQPGDPNPRDTEFYGPWNYGRGPLPTPAQRDGLPR
jgi:hypothetical protein